MEQRIVTIPEADLRDARKAKAKRKGWIRIQDEPPPNFTPLWVCDIEVGEVRRGMRNNYGRWMAYDSPVDIGAVTHYRFIVKPEPPRRHIFGPRRFGWRPIRN